MPAIILGVGINFLPTSPRWLMDRGREEECLEVIAQLRRQPTDSALVQFEFLEMKAQKLFETRVSQHDHPDLQGRPIALGIAAYKSLITNRSNLRRTLVSVLTMLFQQWTGVNFILYVSHYFRTRHTPKSVLTRSLSPVCAIHL